MKQNNNQKVEKKAINKGTVFGVIAVILAAVLVIVAGIGSSWFTNGNIPSWFNYWGQGDLNEPRQLVFNEENDEGELKFETKYIATSLYASRGIEKTAEAAYTLTATANDDGYVPALVWESGFVNPSSAWAQGKNANDYVTVTPAGENSATVVCLGAFGEQIKITAKVEAKPSIYGTRTADYIARVESATAENFPAGYFALGDSYTPNYTVNYGVGTVTGDISNVRACCELSDAAYAYLTTSSSKAYPYVQQAVSFIGQGCAVSKESNWYDEDGEDWFGCAASGFFTVRKAGMDKYSDRAFLALAENTSNQVRIHMTFTYSYGNYSETVDAYSASYSTIPVGDMLDVCDIASLTLTGADLIF